MAASLPPGSRIAHYRVVGPLGAGGMGEVYAARDLTLERSVALKVLPPDLVRSEERVRRFVLEAKSASSLSHPNIVTIYEIGQDVVRTSDGAEPVDPTPVHYIAMELVSGHTLATLIHEERTDLRTLLSYLAQAAEGLAKAHGAGIVHRDLKPGNIMVTNDGFAKVLDFGLAKLTERQTIEGDATRVATRTSDHTMEGAVLGTASYMSPEQVRGKPVDLRSDVFSFGCILHEAATRERPFAGESALETMHRIVHDKPVPIEDKNPAAPAELRRVIRRCLAKNPDERLQSMKDLALELREIVEEYESLSISGSSGSTLRAGAVAAPARSRAALVVGAVLGTALVAIGAVWLLQQRGSTANSGAAPATMRVTNLTNRGNAGIAAISRDGRYVAYVAGAGPAQSLWVRQLATGSEIQAVPPQDPPPSGISFTPDGDYLFYLSRDPDTPNYSALFQVPTLGGVPRKRAFDVDSAVSFAPEGRRVAFRRGAPQNRQDLLVVLDLGSGKEQVLASVGQPLAFTADPVWSPDGKRIAAGVQTQEGGARTWVALFDAETGNQEKIEVPGWVFVDGLAWLPDGSGFVATAIDPGASLGTQLWLLSYPDGRPRRITSDLTSYAGQPSIPGDGASLVATRQMFLANLWVVPAIAGTRPRALTSYTGDSGVGSFDVADGGTIVFSGESESLTHLWSIAADGAARRQLTTGQVFTFDPRWRPGAGAFYDQIEARERVPGIWQVDTAGGEPRRLTSGTGASLLDVSPDGRTVLYRRTDAPDELWSISVAGGEPARLEAPCGIGQAWFSPDGRTLACTGMREDRGRFRNMWFLLPASGGEPIASFFLPPRAFDVEQPPGGGVTFIDEKDGVRGVYSLPLAGGDPRLVAALAAGRIVDHLWSPDGGRILLSVRADEAVNLWTVAPNGTDPIQLTDFETGTIFDTRWFHDGKSVAFTYGSRSSDVVLVRDFR